MKSIVNGGIYNINYSGTSNAEFNGKHPSLVIRTLKENEIYLVVPLTSYTKSKMEKIRKSGYGKRIISTNSIARIDKLLVVHRNTIKNRWMVGSYSLKIDPSEFELLNKKVTDYIILTTQKAEKELEKYTAQYSNVCASLDEIIKNTISKNNMFIIIKKEKITQLICKKSDLYWLSGDDLNEIVNNHLGSHVKITYSNKDIIIEF